MSHFLEVSGELPNNLQVMTDKMGINSHCLGLMVRERERYGWCSSIYDILAVASPLVKAASPLVAIWGPQYSCKWSITLSCLTKSAIHHPNSGILNQTTSHGSLIDIRFVVVCSVCDESALK